MLLKYKAVISNFKGRDNQGKVPLSERYYSLCTNDVLGRKLIETLIKHRVVLNNEQKNLILSKITEIYMAGVDHGIQRTKERTEIDKYFNSMSEELENKKNK